MKMLVLSLLACAALSAGAPLALDEGGYYGAGLFDAHRFWEEMEVEMQRFDRMMSEFYRHFPLSPSAAGVRGDRYEVVVTLAGFEESDIKVKARAGVLMIQALHRGADGGERSYLDLKTLPARVDPAGTWTFDAGVLRVSFPLRARPEPDDGDTTPRDREPLEPEHTAAPSDADVGLRPDDADADIDSDKSNEILTNVIPTDRVEATTYAVDLKNEVEFVPVKY